MKSRSLRGAALTALGVAAAAVAIGVGIASCKGSESGDFVCRPSQGCVNAAGSAGTAGASGTGGGKAGTSGVGASAGAGGGLPVWVNDPSSWSPLAPPDAAHLAACPHQRFTGPPQVIPSWTACGAGCSAWSPNLDPSYPERARLGRVGSNVYASMTYLNSNAANPKTLSTALTRLVDLESGIMVGALRVDTDLAAAEGTGCGVYYPQRFDPLAFLMAGRDDVGKTATTFMGRFGKDGSFSFTSVFALGALNADVWSSADAFFSGGPALLRFPYGQGQGENLDASAFTSRGAAEDAESVYYQPSLGRIRRIADGALPVDFVSGVPQDTLAVAYDGKRVVGVVNKYPPPNDGFAVWYADSAAPAQKVGVASFALTNHVISSARMAGDWVVMNFGVFPSGESGVLLLNVVDKKLLRWKPPSGRAVETGAVTATHVYVAEVPLAPAELDVTDRVFRYELPPGGADWEELSQ